MNLLYVIENNGVYGLTKGQFSASVRHRLEVEEGRGERAAADRSRAARADARRDLRRAQSFCGDKAQLVPILKAGLKHKGFALIDVISPCVSFNDHEGSTKSYKYTREHNTEVAWMDLVPLRREITAPEVEEPVVSVTMHDGAVMRFRKTDESYDPTDREAAYAHVRACQARGEVATGLLFVDEKGQDMHAVNHTVRTPLGAAALSSDLCPGSGALAELMEEFR